MSRNCLSLVVVLLWIIQGIPEAAHAQYLSASNGKGDPEIIAFPMGDTLQSFESLENILPEIKKILPKAFPTDYTVWQYLDQSETTIRLTFESIALKSRRTTIGYKLWKLFHPRGTISHRPVVGGSKIHRWVMIVDKEYTNIVGYDDMKFRATAIF